MKTHKHAFLLAIFIIAWSNFVIAQENTSATGGDIQDSGGTASYTIGQTIYTTISGSGGTAVQGVQNPIIDVVDGIEKARNIELSMSVYPNPTANLLTLKIGNYNSTSLSYQLYDVSGKLIFSNPVKNEHSSISLQNLATATYYLMVLDANEPIKTFSIIKQ